jgi:chromatin structure-remodeling complex subunit RSC1/2
LLDQLTETQRVAMQKHMERELHALEREAGKRTAVTGMTAKLEQKI